MPAGWGSGANTDLAPGKWRAQIRDVTRVEGTDFKDPNKKVEQFKWECDVQLEGQGVRWEQHTVYTGVRFADMTKIKDPQFVPKLNRLVRACGVKLPTSADEAKAWQENDMIGLQFGILVQPDAEDPNTVTTKYVQLPKEEEPKGKGAKKEPEEGRELVGASAAKWNEE